MYTICISAIRVAERKTNWYTNNMKITLNQQLVVKTLSIDFKPKIMPDGQMIFELNEHRKPYFITDAHRDAPVGFGVKVSATKKTYYIQRRVADSDNGMQVIRATLGNVSDFENIAQAREKARKYVQDMKLTKRNPNKVQRETDASELTVKEIFEQYRNHLTTRSKPAKPNTIIVFNKAENRLKEWSDLRIKNLTGSEILRKFDEIAVSARTAAEQTFRWINVAVKHAIEIEAINAQTQQRQPSIIYNPFSILAVQKKYRTRSELEENYRKNNIRNPLSPRDTLKKFLDAVYYKRFTNRLGSDYLLVTILSGTRKEESASLCWRDKITDEEAKKTNYVDLKNRIMFFYDTKNRNNHTLPICDAMYRILEDRRDLVEETYIGYARLEKYVFPARSKRSKTGHYSDSKELRIKICEEAGIIKLGVHDLRRTFGRIAEELASYAVVKRLLNHRNTTDPTERYADPDFERVKEALQRIELNILSKSPRLYNALLASEKYPPINE
jgi:integrase